MPRKSSIWRDDAREAMLRALRQGQAEGLEGKELVRRIDAAYPFYGRENWPYKCWLRERRALLRQLEGKSPGPPVGFRTIVPLPGQLELFTGTNREK